MSSAHTVVLGLGNPVVGDDGVGIAVAAALADLLAEAPLEGVEVKTSGRGGLDLIHLLEGCERVILVDCLLAPDALPGRVRRLRMENVAGSPRLVNSHDVGVWEAFEIARQVGIAMPQQVDIFGVEAGDVSTITEQMTPAVEAAVLPLARRIYAELAAAREAPGQ